MTATFNPFKYLEISTNFDSFYYVPNRHIKEFSFKINNLKEEVIVASGFSLQLL